MHTTLQKLYAHLDKLQHQLQWAYFAQQNTRYLTPEQAEFQIKKVAELEKKINGTNTCIYYAEYAAINLSELIGFQTYTGNDRLTTIDFNKEIHQ